MLWIGILPALAIVYVRFFVKEPPIWVENRRRQRAEKREVKAPLIAIFKRGLLGNTLTACWFQAAGFITYYSINALFATHLQKDLGLSTALIAAPIMFANVLVFLASSGWGWVSDRIGRRWAMILPALVALFLTPLYLLSADTTLIVVGFIAQGLFAGGGMYGQVPSYLNERFPTEIRATATAFCYHQGAIFGGFVPLICRRSLARGSAASPGPRRHFTGPRPKTRFWCPIWSAPETGRARPVGGGERRNARAA